MQWSKLLAGNAKIVLAKGQKWSLIKYLNVEAAFAVRASR